MRMANNVFNQAARWSTICKFNFLRGLNHRCFCTGEEQDTLRVNKQQQKTNQDNDELKEKILNSSLTFVSVHGWSKASIAAGAENIGYPGIIHGMFPRGGMELIQHFYIKSNNKLIEILKTHVEVKQSEPTSELSRILIRDAIQQRLKMIIPYIDRWPEALAIMSRPQNVPTSLANLLTLVDDICYYAGDRSVNMNWYTRRVGLAGLYKITELYMLQDTSEDYLNTWDFLTRRMKEAEKLHGYLEQTENASQFAKQLATATFTTARNILGLNWNR